MGRAGLNAVVALTAFAALVTCCSLLAGCRAKLPAEFSRMQGGQDERGGGDPCSPMPIAYNGSDNQYYPPNLYGIRAAYDRVAYYLSITAQSTVGSDLSIGLLDIPEWIRIPTGTEYIIPGGSGTVGVNLELLPSSENRCMLRIRAISEQAPEVITTVYIHRPLYFSSASYNHTWDELFIDLAASDNQTGFIEGRLPAGVSTTAETRVKFSGGRFLDLPLIVDKEHLTGEDAYFTASDQFGNSAEISVYIYVWPPEYAPDTLYAYPLSSTVAISEPVRIVVATGAPDNPFQYLNSVCVTFSGGEPEFVDSSLNAGATGGEKRDADGIWAAVQPEGFLLPNDFMLETRYLDDTPSITFNVTPLYGTEVTGAAGELFNFEVTFAQAGRIVLGFRKFDQIKRTYYSDADSIEYYWNDLSNVHPGVANAIEVTE